MTVAKKSVRKEAPALSGRTLDARPDTLDFRDRMFEPTLIEVPTKRPLANYQQVGVPILDQGQEGACTGFGLATVIHYLLLKRKVVPDKEQISPRMLYDMARRYDEWPGENYSGSSARGAMKGWYKHGICSRKHWVYNAAVEKQDADLFSRRFGDALRRPLGAYLRVNHKDIIAMHSAISEVDVLYATAQVHSGWDDVADDGFVEWDESKKIEGGHAFALVGYDQRGFWLQNSWGDDWGKKGFAQITYDDWLANGTDVWVARLGAPIELRQRESVSQGVGTAAQGTRGYVFCDLRPHIISLGNDGHLRTDGTYGTSEKDVAEIFEHISAKMTEPKGPTRLLLYAHGGLVGEESAIQKVADLRGALLEAGIHPISFIWKTDFWTTLKNILDDGVKRRKPEGFLDSAKDFMLDRLDDALEPIARIAGGQSQWAEMKENAVLASEDGGGLLVVLEELKKLKRDHPKLEIHMVGHSAGSILLGGLVNAISGGDLKVTSVTFWAPACTVAFYRANLLPAISKGIVEDFAVFAMTDHAEQADNCAQIYHKSLLYLVSHAFEEFLRQPWVGKNPGKTMKRAGEPILGMEKWIESELKPAEREWDLVLSPNAEPDGTPNASRATSHGGFDEDKATLRATLARVLKRKSVDATFEKGPRSSASNRARRERLMISGIMA
jgi:hypothetical protein